jgi:hypothetical protein
MLAVALGLLIKVIRPALYKYIYKVGLAFVGSCYKIRSKVTEYGTSVALIAAAVPIYTFLKDLKKDAANVVEKLSFAIRNAEITHSSSAQFVPRPKIEEQIMNALTYSSLKGGRYTIVYGPRGIGKTELVDHTAIGKKGVVKVTVSSASSKTGVIQAMAKKLLGKSTHSDFDIDMFVAAVQKSGIIPTIIFDVERSVFRDDDMLSTIRSLSKELALYCRCIIVLSEANAVLQFGIDDREKFIYVDEMERDEAERLIEIKQTNITKAEMKYVFEKIGTSPLKLINLAGLISPTYSVEDYVTDVLGEANLQLLAFPHQLILKALKDQPEGVSPVYFNNRKDEGVNLSFPVAVGVAMKTVNAIVYRIELGKYMLMSTAHRTALESYEPTLVTK